MENSKYWDKVYNSKSETEVSWFQKVPIKSLELIKECNIASEANIIDIGGGDSHLVDHLLKLGFSNISILDISSVSLEKARIRLKDLARKITFITSDVTMFVPENKFDLWHDRAAFHFLTTEELVQKYVATASLALKPGGYLIISTFSKNGPEKCSGLPITQYCATDLITLFDKDFQNIKCFEDIHKTPKGAEQAFVYCVFKKR